ncbi:MAG: hypothetical protein RL011_688 [Pseudomonadota bacterium]|jgi:uncharacterized protein (DUF342 family)
MRLLLNKLRLVLTADVRPEDHSQRIEQALLRGDKSLEKLIAEGRSQRIYFTKMLDWATHRSARFGQRLRVVVAIGVPDTTHVKVHKRSLIDRFRGLACRITVEPGSAIADTRLTLAVCAMIAEKTGIDLEDIDDEDVYEALKRARVSRYPETSLIGMYRLRDWQPWLEISEGAVIRRAKTGELALYIDEPESFSDAPEMIAKAESTLMAKLMEPTSGLPLTDIATIMGRFGSLVRRMPQYSRHRRNGPGGRWVIWHQADVGGRSGRSKAVPRTVEVNAEISVDRMQAFLSVKPLVSRGAKITREELRALLKLEGVVDPFMDELDRIQEEVAKGKAVVARLVAAGSLPRAPEQPTLRIALVAEDKSPVVLKDLLEQPSFDIRSIQPKRFVAAGSLVAVVDFAVPGENGRDVLGQELPFKLDEGDDFVAGKGVERRGLVFFALEAGVGKISGKEVTVDAALEIAGNVDLNTGDVEAPGPLSIAGSVESGASVVAKGPITIGQAFAGKYLRATGGLTILGGVQCVRGGILMVTGDTTIKFMQAGILRCRGNVVIESNMTGGVVEATGSVTVLDPQGGIFGGQVIAGQDIKAGNIGRDGGQQVQLWFGSSVEAVRRRGNLSRRRSLLNARLEMLERSGLGGASKGGEKLSRRDERRLVRESIERLTALVAKIDDTLENLNATLKSSTTGALEVKSLLARGSVLARDSQTLIVDSSVMGVKVVATSSGLVLSALEEKKKDE